MTPPEQPRRRHADVVDDRLGKVERDIGEIWSRLSSLEGRVDRLEQARRDHERWFNELQRWMDSVRQSWRLRIWTWWKQSLRRWWVGG